jgi:hypothetical protein
LVDARATIAALTRLRLVSPAERQRLDAAADAVHFTQRDVAALVAAAGLEPSRAEQIERHYREQRVSLKQQDALLLVTRLRAARAERVAAPTDWRFAETPTWKAAFMAA